MKHASNDPKPDRSRRADDIERGRHSSASIELRAATASEAEAPSPSDAESADAPSASPAREASSVVEVALDETPAKPEGGNNHAKDEIVARESSDVVLDPEAYPYGKEGMLEVSSGSQPIDPHQQFRENPRVIYPNGDSLSRPLSVPDSARIGIFALVIAACAIASLLLYFYFDVTANEPKREQEQLQQQLDKDISLDLPNLLSFVDMSDEEIATTLAESGATLFERKTTDVDGEYEVVKIPSDMTLVDAGALYAIGINKLTASQAVSLLNGSWDLDVDRKSGLNISLHYADFKSGSVDAAIMNAVSAEDLERGGISDSGEDDGFGNAYSTGSIMISGETYTWTVSALPLKQVYSLSGMPEDAVYVGIRIKDIV